MQRVVKRMGILAVVLVMVTLISAMVSVTAEARTKTVTKRITLDLNGNRVQYKRPAILDKAKKVRVTSSKKSVVSVRYRKNRHDRRIAFALKKKGKAVVTVRCVLKNGQKRTVRYRVKVTETNKLTALEKGKKAFAIQNKYRAENGVDALVWSDEIYEFCLYRLKNSGLDGHENLGSDMAAFFGNYTKYRKLLFAENLTYGLGVEDAMNAWKESTRHYENLLSTDHVYGAIAVYGHSWCALFFDGDKSAFENWKTYQIREVNIKRYDGLSGTYKTGSRIAYYEEDNKEGTLTNTVISEESGTSVYLLAGKTYVFYEQIRPEGCDKAEKVTVTVTAEGDMEVTLSS